jgi:hypothetical protein
MPNRNPPAVDEPAMERVETAVEPPIVRSDAAE